MHYTAETIWRRGEVSREDFVGRRYSRRHRLRFDGGVEVPGSSSPHVVPLPYSDAAAVDPEEAFVSALSSCHMLWFLNLAAERGFLVESYRDDAVGTLIEDESGKLWMATVTLRPDVRFGGAEPPGKIEQAELHHEAHERCFLARSVRSEVRCEPQYPEP